jgi:hypothetical protein
MRSGKNPSKKLAAASRSKIIRLRLNRNNSVAGHDVSNASSQVFDREFLESLKLADFDEMQRVAKPLPNFSLDGALRGEHEDEIYGVILRLVASRFGGPFALLLNSASGLAQANVLRIYRAAVVSVLVKIGCFFEELASIPKPAATIPADRSNQRFALLTAFLPMCAFVLGPGGQLNREPLDRLLDAANLAPALFERLRELLKDADVDRFRRCAFTKCGRAFYAKYSNSLCCSRRHNNDRLQREWYAREGRAAEQVWNLYQQGMTDVVQISKELGITKQKARAYLARAKRKQDPSRQPLSNAESTKR